MQTATIQLSRIKFARKMTNDSVEASGARAGVKRTCQVCVRPVTWWLGSLDLLSPSLSKTPANPFSDLRCRRSPTRTPAHPHLGPIRLHTWTLPLPSPPPFPPSAQLSELQMHSIQPPPSGFIPRPLILVQRARASSLNSEVESLTRAVEQKVSLVKRSLPSLPPSPRSEPQVTYLRNGRPLPGQTLMESYAIVSISSLLSTITH